MWTFKITFSIIETMKNQYIGLQNHLFYYKSNDNSTDRPPESPPGLHLRLLGSISVSWAPYGPPELHWGFLDPI